MSEEQTTPNPNNPFSQYAVVHGSVKDYVDGFIDHRGLDVVEHVNDTLVIVRTSPSLNNMALTKVANLYPLSSKEGRQRVLGSVTINEDEKDAIRHWIAGHQRQFLTAQRQQRTPKP